MPLDKLIKKQLYAHLYGGGLNISINSRRMSNQPSYQNLQKQVEKMLIMQQSENMKPSWKNLRGAAGATPVAEVVGLCQGWVVAPDNFGNNQIILDLAQCQILKADSPYPYSEFKLPIKYSDSLNSAWGKFGQSVADVFGMTIEELDIDLLKQQWLHLLRIDNVPYGTDRNTGAPMLGTAWKLVSIVQPGAPVQSVHPGNIAAPAVQAVAPAAPMITPAAIAPVVASPVPVTSVAIPVVAAPLAATPVDGLPTDPQARALVLLHGKDLSTFFQTALPDEILRKDPMLIQSILTNIWVASKITSGEVVLQPDGTHSVVGMV